MNIGQLQELQKYLGKTSLIYEKPSNSGKFYVRVGSCVIRLESEDVKVLMSRDMDTPNLQLVSRMIANRVTNLRAKALTHIRKHERGDDDGRKQGRDRQDSGNIRR